MPPPSDHYSSQSQSQQQQQSQWPQAPHLLPPTHNQSSFPSPSSPSTSLGDQHYPPYYPQSQQQSDTGMVDRSSTALSLNLSSLSVTSPTNLSPIHPSPHPGSHMSPLTPISPSNASSMHHQNALSPHHHHHHHTHIHPQQQQQQPFQFTPPEQGGGVRYDDPHYESYGSGSTRRLTSSRSSSSSEKSVPRKRSFTTTSGTPLPNAVNEENAPTPVSGNYDHSNTNMDTSPYDEVDMTYGGLDAEGSPVDGSTSGGEQDDHTKPMEGQVPSNASATPTVPGQVNVMGKPLGTNNFVTKLYQYVSPLSVSIVPMLTVYTIVAG